MFDWLRNKGAKNKEPDVAELRAFAEQLVTSSGKGKVKPADDGRLCALIGNPVSHSLSPVMHNAAFKALGLNYTYVAFEIDEDHLLDTVTAFKYMCVVGFNVTAPFKTSVMRYLDGLSKEAERIDAVNTVVDQNGRFVGFNTDVYGAIRALERARAKVKGERFVVVGAGGAAKAVSYGLLSEGAKVVITNRSLKPAKEIANRFENYGEIDALPMDEGLKKAFERASAVVNCTPVGMYPDISRMPFEPDLIHEGMVVFDLVYRPHETMLLKEAKKRGARTISGLDMLVYQGAISFEFWVGQKAPVETMRNAVEKALENPHDGEGEELP